MTTKSPTALALKVLGVLAAGNELSGTQIVCLTSIRRGSVYDIIDRLERSELITSRIEKRGDLNWRLCTITKLGLQALSSSNTQSLHSTNR